MKKLFIQDLLSNQVLHQKKQRSLSSLFHKGKNILFTAENYRNTVAPILKHCIWSLFMVGMITLFSFSLNEWLNLVNIVLLYLVPVLFSAFWWGRWPSYLSAVSGVLCFDFLFVKPKLQFFVDDIQYLWSFVIFLVVSTLIGGRTEKIRSEARKARQRARSTQAIYEFSKEITAVTQPERIARYLVQHAGDSMERKIFVVLSDDFGYIQHAIRFDPHKQTSPEFFTGDLSGEIAVSWLYACEGGERKVPPMENYLYLPLLGQEKNFGVLGICLDHERLTSHEQRLAEGWTKLAGLAMERGTFAEQARQVETLIEADKLRNTLFNSVSHELKTPLSVIVASVSVLTDTDMHLKEIDKRELMLNMKDSALRMECLVANLLDTARLENGMMKIKLDWCDMGDLIATACRRMEKLSQENEFILEMAADLSLIKADCTLIEQVLVNLIDNAIKYSPPKSIIKIQTRQIGETMEVSVRDQGQGIPEDEIHKVFDKFYRARQLKKTSGTGLGLSICKGIIEAHGGKIYACNHPEGGAVFTFVLDCPPNIAEHERELCSEQNAENFSH